MTTSDDWLRSQNPQWLRNSEDLHTFINWLSEDLGVDLGLSGQVSSRVEVESRQLVFLWHGASPVQERIRLRGQTLGIDVVFTPCPFSAQHVTIAVGRLADSAGDASWNGFVLVGIAGPTEEFLGLTIEDYLPARPADLSKATVAERRRTGWPPGVWARLPDIVLCPPGLITALGEFARNVAGLPVRIEPLRPPDPSPSQPDLPRRKSV